MAARFSEGCDYARYRPSYPEELVAELAGAIMAADAGNQRPVLDVGAGTGIFTHQLAGHLGPGIPVMGIEPSASMIAKARGRDERASVSFEEGTAEDLPLTDGGARAVTAATAAHWFDRPRFYSEAARVLVPGSVLAIIEYVRNLEQSPAARAVLDFLNRYGAPRGYARPDYAAELMALSSFSHFTQTQLDVWLSISVTDFAGLALSSSHAKPAIETMGRDGAEAVLTDVAAPLLDETGHVPFGYRFQLFMVRRRG